MIHVTDKISIDERELEERFIRASGPGGQNVNKLASAVQLRFDVRGSPSLPHDVRVRLERLAGRRLTREGVLVIAAQRHRYRLEDLIVGITKESYHREIDWGEAVGNEAW